MYYQEDYTPPFDEFIYLSPVQKIEQLNSIQILNITPQEQIVYLKKLYLLIKVPQGDRNEVAKLLEKAALFIRQEFQKHQSALNQGQTYNEKLLYAINKLQTEISSDYHSSKNRDWISIFEKHDIILASNDNISFTVKNHINYLIKLISDDNIDRSLKQHEFEKRMPIIIEDGLNRYRFFKNVGSPSSFEFQEMFQLLDLVYHDLLKNRNTHLISIFLYYKISPISRQTLTDIINPVAPLTNPKIPVRVQRAWRSKKRRQLHLNLFRQEPITNNNLSLKSIDPVFKRIVLELCANNAIINNAVSHWTTLNNLRTILYNNNLWGNTILKNHGIFFADNALGNLDTVNGDEKVICCCPYLVDYVALTENCRKKVRQNLVRITINIDKLDSPGKYNQFFKLFDFLAPSFFYKVLINDKLSVSFCKDSRRLTACVVTFFLNGQKFETIIDKGQAIFYGNLNSINRFCILKFFELINQLEEDEKNQLSTYLKSLPENEIKKIITIFAQSMTIYAEYNFNAQLTITPHLISQIYMVESARLYELDELSPAACRKMLLSLPNIPSDISVPSIPYSCLSCDENKINLYGNSIIRNSETGKFHLEQNNDLRAIPNECFSGTNYYETRPGLREVPSIVNQISASLVMINK